MRESKGKERVRWGIGRSRAGGVDRGGEEREKAGICCWYCQLGCGNTSGELVGARVRTET